jgi:2-C-methyl-D-erythritol 4-phosphate cytidylyltransferase
LRDPETARCWRSIIFQRSFETLDSHDGIHEIVAALPAELAAALSILILSRKPVRIVDGGTRRQDSVAPAFARTAARLTDRDSRCCAAACGRRPLHARHRAASGGGAAIAALQAQDTVKEATTAAGTSSRTISRETV